MKQFMYFENQEGGMGVFEIRSEQDLHSLYGWMRPDCKTEDTALLYWMERAFVGELYDHRLGCLVRLKDIT